MIRTLQPVLFDIAPEELMPAARPVLKWAGGKGQLIPQLVARFPVELQSGQIKKYAEPFIGGGALFFYIAHNFPCIEDFYISDANEELIVLYRVIQLAVDSLIEHLSNIQTSYFEMDTNEQKDYFLGVRNHFNNQKKTFDYTKFSAAWVDRAADIIFLNRTCFNGLFRVNSKGLFNVPFGSYNNPTICDAKNLAAVSGVLQRTEIVHSDYAASGEFIDKNTLAYFDPPYRPLSKTANFNSYSKGSFNDTEQARLADYLRCLDTKGAYLMLSNSDPKNEDQNDNFFDGLYKGLTIHRVRASRMINSNASKRGSITEILVTNEHKWKEQLQSEKLKN
jgi:DNA adenine methylase